ncbi:MAG: SH3 domain-containing protein [Lachnospiraceae bacterium]|nr:SH3 domain-containing protein [Lachnospiraceae bacterium]
MLIAISRTFSAASVYAEYITKTESGNTGGNTGGDIGGNTGGDTFEQKNGIVNVDALNVRSGAGTNHSALGLIYQNASVTVIGQEGEWYKVTCVINGATRDGYVYAEYITISDGNNGGGNTGSGNGGTSSGGNSTVVTGKAGIVTADALNFRTGPGTSHSTLGLAYLGTQVNILGQEGDWYKVSCVMNGVLKEGYMISEYVKIVGAADEPYDGETDANFESQIANFPESYKNALRRLHDQHPNWNFVAKYTGLDFEYSVDQENSGNRSMIYVSSTTPFSWLSTAPGDYDWATDTYVNKDGSTWKGASRQLIAYYMDPRNFLDEQQIFMFETQSHEASQNRDVTAGILSGTFMGDGNGYNYAGRYYSYVDTFMEAGQISGASPYFLASRCRQEVGGGSSAADGTYGYYNFFNIGAYASASGNAVQNGINYASQTGSWRRPWTSPWLSIVGGAEFLAQSYINIGQNTDYFQKFNVVSAPYYDHQYMGNIQAPCSEGTSRYSTYKDLGILDSNMTFIIPVYDNMPSGAASIPAATGNPNSYIKYLSINNGSVGLNQTFSYNKLDYTAVTRDSSVNISATPVSQYGSIVSGGGYHELASGNNIIKVVCQAGDGTQTTYTFNIYRQ